MHDGNLTVYSAGEGHGCTFTLQLPLFNPLPTMIQIPIEHTTTSIAVRNRNSLTHSICIDDNINKNEIYIYDIPCHAINKILIVDDAGMNRKMLIKILKGKVDILDEAEDGLIAIERVRQSNLNNQPYDIILMDYVMPNMNGPEATRKIRELGFTGLILGVTGNVLDVDVNIFKSHGADEVLPKPVDENTIEQILKSIFIYIIYMYNIYISTVYI